MYNKKDVYETLDEIIIDARNRGDMEMAEELAIVQNNIDNRWYRTYIGLLIGFGMICGYAQSIADSVVSGVRILINMFRKH